MTAAMISNVGGNPRHLKNYILTGGDAQTITLDNTWTGWRRVMYEAWLSATGSNGYISNMLLTPTVSGSVSEAWTRGIRYAGSSDTGVNDTSNLLVPKIARNNAGDLTYTTRLKLEIEKARDDETSFFYYANWVGLSHAAGTVNGGSVMGYCAFTGTWTELIFDTQSASDVFDATTCAISLYGLIK